MNDSRSRHSYRLARRAMLRAAWRAGVLTPALAAALPALATSTSTGVPAAPAASLESAILAFTGGAPVRAGKVKLEIAPLVDNGNTVPLVVSVDHPMRRNDHVSAVAIFSERNPQHEIASFGLGPHNASARVATRIRLATSQKLVAVARLSDGSHWSGEVDVIVTLAACIED